MSTSTGAPYCIGETAYADVTTRYLNPAGGYTCDVKESVRDSSFDSFCSSPSDTPDDTDTPGDTDTPDDTDTPGDPQTPDNTDQDTGASDGDTDSNATPEDPNLEVMTEAQWEAIKRYYAYQAAIGGANSRIKIITDDQFSATYGMINVLGGLKGSIEALIPKRQPSYMKYKSSDLPQWNFGFSVSGSTESSEIATAASIGRASDSRSLALGLSAEKEKLRLDGQFRFRSLQGKGVNDGNDSDEYSLMAMAGYAFLTQTDNGLNLRGHLFLDLSTNDYGQAGEQFRYTPGFGISVGGMTPLGGISLAYLFSHDRNADGDREVTGKEYLNINTLSLAYMLPLTRSLSFRSDLNYLYVMDLPADAEESGTNIDLGLNYVWKQYWIRLSVVKNFAGFDREGVHLAAGYYW